jgi:cytochrome P450
MLTSPTSNHRPPHASGLPFIGVLPRLLREPLTTLSDAAQYGDVVFLGPRTYLVTNSEIIRHILIVNQRNYQRSNVLNRLRSLIGDGLFLSSGELWQRQRRLIQPIFHRKRLDGMADQIVDATDVALDAWMGQEQIDVSEALMRLTLTIAFRILLNRDEQDSDVVLIGRLFRNAIEHLTRRLNRFVDLTLPTAAERHYRRVLESLDDRIYKLIAERRADPHVHDDLLGMLLAARDEDTGQSMNDRALRDEVLTMLLAGHESTAASTSWALALLATQPAAASRLRDEVDQVLEGRTPCVDDLPQLPYSRAFIDEMLRLYPSAWMLTRQALQPDQLGPYSIPAGATVIVSPYVNHRLSNWWPAPDVFQPERWLDTSKPASTQFAYFPFGAGPRMCVGQHLAILEMSLILVRVVQRCELEIDGALPKPVATVSIQPDRRLRAQVRPRRLTSLEAP